MRRYRVLFLMQQVLGHVSHSSGLERVARADPELEVIWVPVAYHRPGGVIERVFWLRPGTRGVLRAATEVQRALLRHRPEAVLFNSPALATSALAWMRRLPATISLDVTPRQFDREGEHFGHRADGNGVVAGFKHRVNRAVVREARVLAPWARWSASSLIEEYGADPARVEVVPPGVDLQLWQPSSSPQVGLPRVLFVGGDFLRKGGDALTEWFRSRGRSLCQLTIVSRHPAALAARALGAEVRTDLGPNSPELVHLYQQSHVFALPSRSEPFGIAAVEALACALPSVVGRTGGLTDIVEDGVNGYLVAPGDGRALALALETLIGDATRRRRMGAAGRRRAEARFEIHRNGARLLELVKSSVEARKKEAARMLRESPP